MFSRSIGADPNRQRKWDDTCMVSRERLRTGSQLGYVVPIAYSSLCKLLAIQYYSTANNHLCLILLIIHLLSSGIAIERNDVLKIFNAGSILGPLLTYHYLLIQYTLESTNGLYCTALIPVKDA